MKNIYKYIALQGYALSPTASGHNPAKVALTPFSEYSLHSTQKGLITP